MLIKRIKNSKKDYKKVSKVNQDIIDTFPKAKGKTVYQLKDLSSDEESELEDILMKPMLIITSLDSMDTSSKVSRKIWTITSKYECL